MSKDKYSDNHTIVINKGSGTLTVDGNLSVNGAISSSGSSNLGLSGEDIAISADRNITIAGGSADNTANVVISSGAGFADKGSQIELSSYTNSLVFKAGVPSSIPVTTLADGVALVAKDDINIYGGAGSINGVVTISANNGSSPKLELSESTNTATITANTAAIIANNLSVVSTSGSISTSSSTVSINGTTSINLSAPAITITQSERVKTTSIPGASFMILEKYDGDGNATDANAELQSLFGIDDEFRHTENGSIYWAMDTTGSGYVYGHVFAPLPDHIPDGSTITHLGGSVDLYRADSSDTKNITVMISIRKVPISDGVGTTVASEGISRNLTGYHSFLSECIPVVIDRENYTYTILGRFQLEQGGSRKQVYLKSARLRYKTTKLDPNL